MITVRGTEFLATVENNRTVIDLYAGKIEIQGVNGCNTAAVAIVAGQSVALGPESAAPVIGETSQPTDPALVISFKVADGDELAVEFRGEDR